MSVERILARLRDETARLTTEAEASVREERAKVGPVLAAMAEGQRGMKAITRYPAQGYFNLQCGKDEWVTPDAADAWIKAMRDKCEAIRADNVAAEKHNAALVAAAIEYCTLLGFPKTQRYTTKSGRKESTHEGPAKWSFGLHELAPRDDQWSSAEYTLRGWSESIYKWRESIRVAGEERAAAARRAEADRLRAEAERARIAEQVRQEITGKTPQQQRNEALAERIRDSIPSSSPPIAPTFDTPGKALEID